MVILVVTLAQNTNLQIQFSLDFVLKAQKLVVLQPLNR